MLRALYLMLKSPSSAAYPAPGTAQKACLLLEILFPNLLLLSFRNERCFISITITDSNIVHTHTKYFMCDAIFVIQVCFEHFRVIGIDRDAHAKVKKLFQWMFDNRSHRICQVIAPRVDFQCNAVFFEQLHNLHIFNRMNPVTDAIRVHKINCLFYKGGGRIFTSMNGDLQTSLLRFSNWLYKL